MGMITILVCVGEHEDQKRNGEQEAGAKAAKAKDARWSGRGEQAVCSGVAGLPLPCSELIFFSFFSFFVCPGTKVYNIPAARICDRDLRR
jgi:hypothetical protein